MQKTTITITKRKKHKKKYTKQTDENKKVFLNPA